MDIVVGEFTMDGLESGPEFAAPIIACSNVDVGNESDRKLRVINLEQKNSIIPQTPQKALQ